MKPEISNLPAKALPTNKLFHLILSIALVAVATARPTHLFANSDAGNENEIYEKFKKQLSFQGSYRQYCQLAVYTPGRDPLLNSFILYSSGKRTVLYTLTPERDKGKVILMIGNSLWQYFPRIKKTMNINAGLSIQGGVNITDLTANSLFDFYDKTEQKHNSKTAVTVFTFQAKDNTAPYGRIEYYFNEEKIQVLKVYARSGILLKEIYFTNYKRTDDGELYPSRIKIVNSLRDGDYVLMQITGIKKQTIPESYFNPAALDKVKP